MRGNQLHLEKQAFLPTVNKDTKLNRPNHRFVENERTQYCLLVGSTKRIANAGAERAPHRLLIPLVDAGLDDPCGEKLAQVRNQTIDVVGTR